jgi:Fe-S-cluster containining protein
MLFDHCAQCQSCCHVDAGYPPLEITLSTHERKTMGRLCIESTCVHLSATGCTLADDKPFGCQLYPLSYNPKSNQFFFDAACPLMPAYQQQLADPTSEASEHLSRMKAAIQAYSLDDPSFLRRNFRVDEDYFDLQPLGTLASTRKATDDR